ncbi:PAS domain-containing protein [Fulvimonas yonginensis]|uniref:PAS domain-containing protein n=1 Tax=Fulvimonas yonginensis TaxID=1495200 RepID=A0ABU8JA36_9GAMM
MSSAERAQAPSATAELPPDPAGMHPLLLDALPFPVLLFDGSGRLVTANAAAGAFWGEALCPGVHADDLLAPPPADGSPRRSAPVSHVLASGQPLHGASVSLVGAEGATMHAAAAIVPLPTADGAIARVVCSLQRQPD